MCTEVRRVLVALCLFLASGGAAAQQHRVIHRKSNANLNMPKHMPYQLLVKYRSGMEPIAKALNSKLSARVERAFKATPGLQLLRLPGNASFAATLRAYRSNPAVQYAEPNYVISLRQSSPADPEFGKQWALQNTGQLLGIPGADIKALDAWNLSKGDTSVVVATLDTGIDYTHPDLASNIFQNTADCNANGVDDDGDGYVDDCHGINTDAHTSDPMDDVGHGTHVAGIIGAAANNGTGIAGVNWNARLLPCKFINSYGYGTVAGAIECLDWLRALKQRGVNIVASNNSWGISDFSQALADAVKAQEDAGILFIAAAGNDFENNDIVPVYPANLPYSNVISVAATNRFDDLASFSNTGRWSVHIGAPGEEIFSTLPGAEYGYDSGTSMAAPFVTGVAALLKAQDPSRDWKTLKNLLLAGGDTLPQLVSTITGKRLDAYGAMTCSSMPILSRLSPAGNVVSVAMASPITIAVVNVDCGSPAGPINATVSSTGDIVTLKDDGIAPDEVAGDGIYTGQWAPPSQGTFAVTIPGGDQFSVNVLTNYYAQGEAPNYRAITGTSLDLADDSVAELTPPFPITFGGATFQKLYISSNGTISLTNAFSDYYNRYLPLQAQFYTPYGWDRTAAIVLAPFWDDLYPIQGSGQNVYWEVKGDAPTRELVIEWRDVRFFDCRTDPNATVRFQAIFLEASNDMFFQYAKANSGCPGHEYGASATVGVQIDPHTGSTWSYVNESISDNTALHWRLVTDPTPPNPVPVIYKIEPNSAAPMSGALPITVTGSNFVPGSQVRFIGLGRATTFVTSTQLSATLHDADTRLSGLWKITVVNPAPGGGESNGLNLGVGVTPPLITSLSPSSATAGGPGFTLTVTGQNLNAYNPSIIFGTTYHAATVISDTVLQASITAGEVANPGTVYVTAANGPGGSSNILLFTITPKSPSSAALVQNNGQGVTLSRPMPNRFYGWRYGERLPSYTKAFSGRKYGAGSWPMGGANATSPVTAADASAPTFIPKVAAHPSMPAGFIPSAVATGDFNGDGHQDWVVSNGGDSTLWLYAGNGDGTAAPPVIISLAGSSPTAVAAVDLRGIGVLDLVVAEADSLAVEVLLGRGDGNFTSAGQQFVPGIPTALAVGDFNGDGHPDISVGMLSFEGFGAVAMCPGDGTGRLRNPVLSQDDSIWANYATTTMATADFDNDGKPDLVMVYGTWDPFFGFGTIGTRAFLNDGAGKFKPGALLFGASFDAEFNMATGDLNNDGCSDVVAVDAYGILHSYLGHCDGTFTGPVNYPEGELGYGIALADVNGDGNLDAVTSGVVMGGSPVGYGFQSGQLLTVSLGDGKGGFGKPTVYRGGLSAFSITVVDLNEDGKPDIVTADQDSDTSTQFLNDGHGDFGMPSGGYIGYIGPDQGGAVNQPASDVLPVEVNGDGKPDLVWLTSQGYTDSSSDITVLLNQGQGKYSAPIRSVLTPKMSFGGFAFAFGDFRHTGKQDLIFMGESGPGLGEFYLFAANLGDGKFAAGSRVPANGWMPLVVTGDFDRDGNLDFATVYGCALSVYAGKDDGTFVEKPAQQLAVSGQSICQGPWPAYGYVADFNHDGKLDILFQMFQNQVPYQNHDVYLLLGNGDGTFQPPWKLLSNLRNIEVADLDGDGNLDIVEAADFMDADPGVTPTSFRIYMGRPDGSFALKTTYEGMFAGTPPMADGGVGSLNSPNANGGWLADFDGDGTLDIAAIQVTASLPRLGFVQFMHGNGDGTFTPLYGISPLSYIARPSRAVDFLGTGRADLIEFDGFSSAFQIIPVVAGSNISGIFIPQPIPGDRANLRLSLSATQPSAVDITLAASGPNVMLPASVQIPAGQVQTEVPVTLSPGFDRSRVIKVTATSGSDSAVIYGVPASDAVGLRTWANWSSYNLIPGGTTGDYNVGVVSVGGYSTVLTANCEGLPTGAACLLSPTQVALSAGGTTTISTIVTTSSAAPQGTYKFAVVLTDGITTARQPLTLGIGDFSVRAIDNIKNVYPSAGVSFGVAIESTNGYSGAVTLSCAGLPVSISCSPTIGWAGSTTSIWIYSQSAPAGQYPFTIIGESSGVRRSTSATLRVVDVTGSISPTSANVKVGQTAEFDLTISAPEGFYEPLSLYCGAGSAVTCSFSQNPVNFAAGSTSAVVHITLRANSMPSAATTTTSVATSRQQRARLPVLVCFGLAFVAMMLPSSSRRSTRFVVLWVVVLTAIAVLSSCGGGNGGNPIPPPGNPSPPSGSKQMTVIVQGHTGAPSYYVKNLGSITLTVSQ